MPPPEAIPSVSIGLPVFNGAEFLEDAIRSVLSQTLQDLELVICDNASTDRTEQICRRYERLDPRIVYVRNERNLGAVPNFALALAQARGRYFKWLAHDDRLKPGYLAATVAALDSDPEAVLCNTAVSYIGASGEPIAVYDTVLGAADGSEPQARFAVMVLCSHSCVDFFGVMRREAIPGTLPAFHGMDRAFLARMALRGRLIQLPEPLIEMREHRGRYTRRVAKAEARLAWHDASLAGRWNLPTWRLFAEYVCMVRSEGLSLRQRVVCYGVLAQWWVRNWNVARAMADLVEVFAPGAVLVAEQAKARLFGLAPGHFRDSDASGRS